MTLMHNIKVTVPTFVSTKAYCMAAAASPWFAVSVPTMLLDHSVARPAALVCVAIGGLFACASATHIYVEYHEKKKMQERKLI